ncbi:MAG: DUF1206 domain-containing protein [Chitinophagaceae bacterium]
MAQKEDKKPYVRYLPIYGCVSTGIIYTAIGVIAILSFFNLKQGGADEGSLLAYLNDYLAGRILIWIILLGTISYFIWRIYESIKDPYEYGSGAKGIITRTGIALSAIPDGLIAYSAITILLGQSSIQEDGQPQEQRQMAEQVLNQGWGDWLMVTIGVIVMATAVVQLVYGLTNGYRERIDIAHFSAGAKKTIHALSWAGYVARGIIISIIGFFFIKGGLQHNAQQIVNTDKAFDFIGDHVGHAYFIIVALGTICYGLFMFMLGLAYDADKG